AASFIQLPRQLRQKPARFIRSMFCTSVRERRCSTSRRNTAASSSVWVFGSSGMGIFLDNRAEDRRSGRGPLLILQRQADVIFRNRLPAGARAQEIVEFAELDVALERRVLRKAMQQ